MEGDIMEKLKDNINKLFKSLDAYSQDDYDIDEEIKPEYSKQELMDIYGLEDWQADLVLKGEYEIGDFEEEEIEDDSYYDDEE